MHKGRKEQTGSKTSQVAFEAGRILWDYFRIGEDVRPVDAILVLGGHDLRVAEWAAQLWLMKLSKVLICSGGLGYYTREIWNEPEAHKFRRVAVAAGVDPSAILIEDQSTNSGENVRLTRKLTEELQLDVQTALCVQKPYLERRTLLTFRRQWPELELRASSPPITYDRYPAAGIISREKLLNEMVGQVDRKIGRAHV